MSNCLPIDCAIVFLDQEVLGHGHVIFVLRTLERVSWVSVHELDMPDLRSSL